MENLETYQYLKLIVDAMDCTIDVYSIVQIGSTNQYKCYAYNTKWISSKRKVTINMVEYQVVDIEANDFFTIELSLAQSPPTPTVFTIPAPFFYKGTFISQNNELSKIPNTLNKTPFIHFHEPSRDRIIRDPESSLHCISNPDLYAMMDCDFKNWTTDQHYKYCISATSNIIKSFIQAAENANFVSELSEDYTTENHVRFGTINEGGHEKKIFNDNLSGKKFTPELPFFKIGCDDNYTNPFIGSIRVFIDGVLVSELSSSNLNSEIINITWI